MSPCTTAAVRQLGIYEVHVLAFHSEFHSEKKSLVLNFYSQKRVHKPVSVVHEALVKMVFWVAIVWRQASS